MSKPSVAIAVLNFNGGAVLKKTIESVILQNYWAARLYVIDNCSTDDSVNWLATAYPDVTVVQNEKNFGFAKGYNVGLQTIKADFFLLLNNDVQVTKDFLEPMVDVLQNNKMAAVCQPKILSSQRPDHFEYAGAGGGWMDMLGYPFARGRIFLHCEKDNMQYNDVSEIFWASGACFLIRSSMFWQMGGFYEPFFMQHEETDLCWRLKNAGNKIFYTGQSVVYHEGGAQLGYGSSEKTYLNFRNNWVMLYRNLPIKYFWFVIFPFRTMLDFLAAFYFLTRGKAALAVSVCKALSHFWSWWRQCKFETSTPTQSIFSLSGVFKRPIVFYYFLLNKTNFKDL